MMKKSVFILIMLAGCLLLGSCAVSADQMLEEFNGQIYEDLGGGDYVTDGKPNVSKTLIKNDVYRVMEESVIKVEASNDFLAYKWTVTDNDSKVETVISQNSFAYINTAILKLSASGDYTLTLLAKNRNNLMFMDKATLQVVKNIYN